MVQFVAGRRKLGGLDRMLSDERAENPPTQVTSWKRRQAVQIAAMLPENAEEAREVLRLTMALLDTFLSPPAADKVVSIFHSDKNPATARRD